MRVIEDEGHRGCNVALCVSLDWDAVDYDFGVTLLWDNACSGAEGRGEDRPVPVYLVVGRLACEGQDEIVGEARAPSPRKKSDLGCTSAMGLVDGGAECSHYFRRVKFLGSRRDLVGVGEDGELSV